jgi:hypothetical protein
VTSSEDQTQRDAAWEQHNLAQLLHFRSLTLRQKMQAIEELGVIARRLQEQREQRQQLNSPKMEDQ